METRRSTSGVDHSGNKHMSMDREGDNYTVDLCRSVVHTRTSEETLSSLLWSLRPSEALQCVKDNKNTKIYFWKIFIERQGSENYFYFGCSNLKRDPSWNHERLSAETSNVRRLLSIKLCELRTTMWGKQAIRILLATFKSLSAKWGQLLSFVFLSCLSNRCVCYDHNSVQTWQSRHHCECVCAWFLSIGW